MVTSNKEHLLEALEKIQGVRVLVVGDVILDRYVWGKVDRISPEAPVPVVEVGRTEDRLGGAANVARNLCGIGAQSSLCGCIGDDEEGHVVLALLADAGIDREGVLVDRGRPTSLKTRVIASSQQVLRIDRERKVTLSAALGEGFAAVVDAHLDASRGIVISDYGKGVISEAVIRRFADARSQGRVGLRSRPLVLDPHPANYGIYRDVSILKPNRKEAEAASSIAISDRGTAEKAARALITRWNCEMVMITLGEDGLMLLEDGQASPFFIETIARHVYDVSGAGDTVTALFAAALAAGVSPRVAGDLANIGGGIVVSEIGTVSITKARMMDEIERLAGTGDGHHAS